VGNRSTAGTIAGRDPDKAVAILAVGTMVLPSLAAADTLNDSGMSATVVKLPYLKPHDARALAESSATTAIFW